MAHEFHEFTRNMLNYINGDLIGRTNFHKFNIFGGARHSPNKFGSALACAKIREISATDQVAILPVERD